MEMPSGARRQRISATVQFCRATGSARPAYNLLRTRAALSQVRPRWGWRQRSPAVGYLVTLLRDDRGDLATALKYISQHAAAPPWPIVAERRTYRCSAQDRRVTHIFRYTVALYGIADNKLVPGRCCVVDGYATELSCSVGSALSCIPSSRPSHRQACSGRRIPPLHVTSLFRPGNSRRRKRPRHTD